MTGEIVKLVFKNKSDLSYTNKTFYFSGYSSDGQPNDDTAANFKFTRAVNKNIITTNLPVSSYTGGGLAIDIGMSEDTFDITYTTYSYNDYRYLCALAKCNNDLKVGDLTFIVQGVTDTFSVGLKNIQFNMKAGAGFICDIKLSLVVVDPDLSKNTNAENLVY